MSNNSGFYRVSRQKYTSKTLKGNKTKYRWIYNVENELINKRISSKSLIILKLKVIEQGLIWGITDLEKAEKSAKIDGSDIKNLEGQYGIKVREC